VSIVNAAPSPFDIFRAHGGKVATARALFPGAQRPWMDLSTGISPWAYPYESLLEPDAFMRLPDPEALAGLEAAASACFGVADASRVIALPGTDIGLRLLGPLFPEASVAVVRPGYSGHVSAWMEWSEGSSGRVRPAKLIRDADLEIAAREHDIVVLANPGTPDGRTIERERLLEAGRRLERRNGLLIIDEAYVDAQPALSLCAAASDAEGSGASASRNLIVFRSFGKFFGLPGLRLGFIVVPRDQAHRFRHALGDWPLTGPAIGVGTAAYLDTRWHQMQRERVALASSRLDAMLKNAGLIIEGGTPLFRLARCANADSLFRHLASHAILTRPFADDSGLLRIGLPGEEMQWKRLAAALETRST
jgi:cobalamin biosynthetic protein CobC